MCGRYDLNSPPVRLKTRFETDFSQIADLLAPRYNIAPAARVAIVRLQDDQRRSAPVIWGLTPRWVKDLNGPQPINARAETVADKPMFRDAFKRRRCLIPADGFYEWKRVGNAKQPYRFVMRDGEPFAFGGIWESWHAGQTDARETCAMVTTLANAVMAPIHDRMPVIVLPADYARWLDPANDKAYALLKPLPNDLLRAYPVSTRVNNARNDDAELLRPLTTTKE